MTQASELTPEIEGVSVVLVGSFNPAIFQPQWFARMGLVRPQEAEGEACKIEIVRPEVTVCTVGPFHYEVDTVRFAASTTSLDALTSLRDLVVNTFRILEHTPLTAMGLNRHMHFKMASEADYHDVGHRLAPKALWDGLIANPGLASLQISGLSNGNRPRRFTVSVQPSSKVKPGVFIATNEEYKVEQENAPELLTLLQDNWESTQRGARTMAGELLARCLAKVTDAE